MEPLNQDTLLYFLATNKAVDGPCDHSEYLAWNDEKEALRGSVEKIGQLSVKPVENPYDIDYWGANAPINLEYYPYHGCEIFQCQKCKGLFLHYVELGGHAAQKRYRLIRKELIDLHSIKPKTQIIIDCRVMDFVIYKNPDLTYTVSICKAIGVGVEICHPLTQEEENSYTRLGIPALAERMKDMDTNYNKYKATSWR